MEFDMNYEKNYYDYVKYAKGLTRTKGKGVYYEKHHVIPRSLGGTDSKDNIVLLTAREHYLAHYLLMKIYEPFQDWRYTNMVFDFHMMNWKPSPTLKNTRGYLNSRLYESLRKHFAKASSLINTGRKYSDEVNKKKASAKGKSWYHNSDGENKQLFPEDVTDQWEKGRLISKELAEKLAEHARKISRELTPAKGKTWKLKDSALSKQKGRKQWWYNRYTGESKIFLSWEEKDESIWIRGRKNIGGKNETE